GGYALFSDNLEADVEAMQKRGLAVHLQPANGRARPDGQQLRWRSAVRDNGSMTPFFLQDETPRNLRVPDDPDTTNQPNGVKGISVLTIAVPDLAVGIDAYEMMTGIKAVSVDYESAHLMLEGVELVLALQPDLGAESKLSDIQLIGDDNHP